MLTDKSGSATHKFWSRGALVLVPACPACGSSARRGYPWLCRDHRIQLEDIWELHRCADCDSLYLDPRPDDQSLPLAYDVYQTHRRSDETPPSIGPGAILWRLIHGYLNSRFAMNRQPASKLGVPLFMMLPPFRLKLDYYGRHLFSSRFPRRGNLLDVGCGNGAFLARAGEMGWAAVGLEPDPKAVVTCREQNLEVVQGVLDAAPADWKGRFDVITMSHAIEHVPNPKIEIQRCFDFLKPGGFLWIALPNPKSLGARFFRAQWRELSPPYHLCIPSQRQLLSIIESAGFMSVRCLPIGSRNRRSIIESAENVRFLGGRGTKLKSTCAPLISIVNDILSSVASPYGEETVVTARRPFNS